jgi:hypothetical protein
MATRVPPDALDSWATLFGEALFDLMIQMTKAETVEPRFAKIQQAAKKMTKSEIHRIADIAGRYCAEHSNPSPGELSREQWERLKKRALEFALNANHT